MTCYKPGRSKTLFFDLNPNVAKSWISRRRRRTNSQIQIQAPPNAPRDEIQRRPVPCRAKIWWIRAVPNIQDACGEATPPPLSFAVLFTDLIICIFFVVAIFILFGQSSFSRCSRILLPYSLVMVVQCCPPPPNSGKLGCITPTCLSSARADGYFFTCLNC